MRATRFGPITVRSDDRVLAPRAWTLLQSEWAAELAGTHEAGPLLELCSGAGQIGLAAAALSGREVVQLDDDPHACMWARRNARDNGIRADVRVGALSTSDQVLPRGRFPLVLADPPYLTSFEVRAHPGDPPHAVDGGADGLAVVRASIDAARRHARPGAGVLMQLRGEAQVAQLAEELGGGAVVVEDWRSHDRDRAVALLRMAA